MNNDKTEISVKTQNEIFQDALFFQVLFEIAASMDNYEAVVIVGRFLKLQSVVFIFELFKFFEEKNIELNVGIQKDEFVKRLKSERTGNGIKYSPINSDRIKSANKV